jgi:periplasmic protein TonB
MRRAALISLVLHAVLLIGLVAWFARRPGNSDAPDKEGAVELVMVESQNSGPATAPHEAAPDPPTPPEQTGPTPPPPVETLEAEAHLPLPSPPAEAPSPDAVQPDPPAPEPAAPPVQQAMQAPVINLPGNDSETNAIVTGAHVIPASIDAKFRNREPVYPADAARRAEQGAVILLIHVSPDGLARGVDVMESSGHASLDRAARDAVSAWHFLPAVKDGQPIPFDFVIRVTFQLE